MVRKILALAALATLAGSADAALVCHDARHHVIRCVHRPIVRKVIVRRSWHRGPVHPYRHVLRHCHDGRGRTIVCRR